MLYDMLAQVITEIYFVNVYKKLRYVYSVAL
jgi:hypothetical protein